VTIHAPTYPNPAGFPCTRFPLPMNVRGWTFDEVELTAKTLPLCVSEFPGLSLEWDGFAPTVVDDSPAALIARLTAGDAGENS